MALAEVDQLVLEPDGGRCSTTLDLLHGVRDSFVRAGEYLRSAPPDEQIAISPTFVMQGRLLLGCVVGPTQACGHQTVVARLAIACGVDALPFAASAAAARA